MRTVRVGKDAEGQKRFIERLIVKQGYHIAKTKPQFSHLQAQKSLLYVRNYEVGPGLYGIERKANFVLYRQNRKPNFISILSRWQKSGGTTDEKYSYWVESTKLGYFDTIIVLDGSGYRDEARNWLIGQAGRGKLMHVFNQVQFHTFVQSGGI